MKRFFGTAALLFAAAATLCGCGMKQPLRTQGAATAMGTVVRLTLYTSDGDEDDIGEIVDLIQEMEEDTLSRRLESSEIYRINQAAGSGEGTLISDELADALERCMELKERCGGAFDPAIGALVKLWDIDGWASGLREGDFFVPDSEKISEALAQGGSEKIRLERKEDGTALFTADGVILDLGAVGKGMALDRVLDSLKDMPDISGACVSVGGSVLTYGEKPDGTKWKIGIADPDDPSVNIGFLSVHGQWCISTSGDYERYVMLDGRRYHHILDPATGYPADSGVRSVTVLTKDGFLSDGLSTACFVLGRQKGMELAQSYGAEVLFVDSDGKITMSQGMKEYFQEAD